jgi:putative addiction module component (TIGR02574 family)
MSVTAIQKEILGLPATERARLIDVLWDSISAPEQQAREAAWAAESERRIDAYDAGELTARDATEVFADLKKGLPK